ncbi:GspE/PulE family protein [Candidatus Laterigemmans baculatus]|uniref:GspE/PulE family protein n=1 Tax=Candidatus Laterigemmans baculatus TaxID=2770505 RepID=UPI0013DBADBF|nr:ATPase, T2SS/T4P/T4SS family [Candidatus Laterigemmans baculatus]
MTWINTLTESDARLDRGQPLIMRLIEAVDRLDPERLEQVYNAPLQGNVSIEESLLRAGLADEHQIARAYSDHYLLPIFDPPPEEAPPVDRQVASLLPAQLCREHRIAPLADDGTTLDVAIFSPDSLWLADDLRLLCGRHMRPFFTPLSVIEKLLHLLYPTTPGEAPASWKRDAAAVQGKSPPTLPPTRPLPPLESLGLSPRQRADLSAMLSSPHGLVLFGGPRRSGRSTSLQSCLKFLDKPNVCTIDAQEADRLTVASALRAWLRQDPDVVAVDQIRNGQTAQICVRAALTGHFVLSTLECDDAFSAVSRLAELEVDAGSLAETLQGLVCQRLVRRLCSSCRSPQKAVGRMARRYGLSEGVTVYRPVGCGDCDGTGYRGLLPIFEVIRVDPPFSRLIRQQSSLETLQRGAIAANIPLLPDSMAEAIAAGLTSFEEAMSIPPRRDRRGH